MQLLDGAPVYSATDLVGFLACGHRFELERAALAGLVTKPVRSDPTIELIQERGYEHERRYLDGPPGGRPDDRGDPPRRLEREHAGRPPRGDRAHRRGDARRRRRCLPGHVLRRDVARPRRLPAAGGARPDGSAERVRRLALRGRRHEARPPRHVRRRPPGLRLRRPADARSRVFARSTSTWRSAAAPARRSRSASTTTWPTTAASRPTSSRPPTRRGSAPVVPARRDVPGARPALRRLPLVDGLSRPAPRRRRPQPRRRDLRRASGAGSRTVSPGSRPGRIATRRGLAALDLDGLPRLDWTSRPALARVREQARIQVEGEDRGEMLWELLEPERADDEATGEPRSCRIAASSCCPNRRRATSSSTSRAIRSPSTTGSTTSSGSSSRARRRSTPDGPATARPSRGGDRAARPTLPRLLEPRRGRHRHARRREGRLRADRRPHHRPPRRRPDAPRLPLRGLREDRPGPARPAPRDARGGGRPAAARPRPRRPLPGRPPGDPRQRRELLDQAARAAVRLRARRRAPRRRGQHRRVRGLARPWGNARGPRRRRDPRRDRGVQPRRRPLHVAAARLARGPAARPRGAARDGRPAPAAPARGRRARGARRARGRGRRGRRGAHRGPRRHRARRRARRSRQATWLLAQLLGWHRRENKAFWWRYYDLCGRDGRRARRGARATRHGRARSPTSAR